MHNAVLDGSNIPTTVDNHVTNMGEQCSVSICLPLKICYIYLVYIASKLPMEIH